MERIVLFALLSSVLFSKGYEPFLSFSASKSELVKIYANHKVLPLSQCRYGFDPKGCSLAGIVDFKSCDYKVQIDPLQAAQVDWMHVMQAYEFGKGLSCLTQKECHSKQSGKAFKGIRCCKKLHPKFKHMYADMHNIIPVIGEEKKVRGGRAYLAHDKALEPQDQAKGIIARAYLYMIDTYDLDVDQRDKAVWLRWHKKYPPSVWEERKNRKIFKLQGTSNPFVKDLTP